MGTEEGKFREALDNPIFHDFMHGEGYFKEGVLHKDGRVYSDGYNHGMGPTVSIEDYQTITNKKPEYPDDIIEVENVAKDGTKGLLEIPKEGDE